MQVYVSDCIPARLADTQVFVEFLLRWWRYFKYKHERSFQLVKIAARNCPLSTVDFLKGWQAKYFARLKEQYLILEFSFYLILETHFDSG